MCPQGAVFLQYSLESVVSSERLLEKTKFFDSLTPAHFLSGRIFVSQA